MGFLIWHYTSGPKKFLEVSKNILAFFWRFFGVSLHLRTLFSPWKRDISRVARRGFHPGLWLQSAAENAITRFVGMIVRIFTISFGLLVELIAIFLAAIFFVIWFLLPIFLLSIIVALAWIFTGAPFNAMPWLLLFFLTLGLYFFSRTLWSDSQTNYLAMSLQDLTNELWFTRVWERVGKIPSETTVFHLADTKLFDRYLESCHVSPQEFQQIVSWEVDSQIESEKESKFWLRENLDRINSIGKDWTFAYTVNLDRHSSDLSKADYSEYRESKLVGHDQDLAMLELILTRPNQNNVMLVAEAGIGRHTLVHTLAKKIRERKADHALKNKRILDVKLDELVSSVPDESQLDAELRRIFFEAAYAGNVVLVISDIDRYLKQDARGPREDISAVLIDFLNYPTFQIIGITTPEKYHEELERNEGIMKYFEKVQLGEAEKSDSIKVLLHRLKDIERNRVIFTYPAIRELHELAERYFNQAPFPEKALDLAEEAMIYWSQHSSEKYITPQVIAEVIAQKIHVPIGEMDEGEKEKLLKLEDVLHERVVGQEYAIKQISETMRRARIGMANKNRPIGSFLFLGPTGVGKTESAKALAEAYFGEEKRMIRLDMSEYQRVSSIDRLIGSIENKKTGLLADKVRENPYALLLLDEIEKANPDILNLFLQILDEGFLTDVFGKKINFTNQIIIATSNAGADIIKTAIENQIAPEEIEKQVTDHVIKNGIFRPEFLNRFEGVIFFNPLSSSDILKVTEKLLSNYAERLQKEKNIAVVFESGVVEEVAEKSFDPVFGARAVHRFVEDKIGDSIVRKIISGEAKEGKKLSFSLSDMK